MRVLGVCFWGLCLFTGFKSLEFRDYYGDGGMWGKHEQIQHFDVSLKRGPVILPTLTHPTGEGRRQRSRETWNGRDTKGWGGGGGGIRPCINYIYLSTYLSIYL